MEVEKAYEEDRTSAIIRANKWKDFYKRQLSSENTTTQTLPEEFGDRTCRGNDFPTHLFGIPMCLSATYGYIPKGEIAAKLRQPWTALYVDMNGGHFKTYVKRQNGSIAEINDGRVVPVQFKSTEDLITHYTKKDSKHSLRCRVD